MYNKSEMKVLLRLAVLSSLVLVWGCSSDLQAIRVHLDELNSRVAQLERDLDQLRQELKDTRDQQDVLKEQVGVLKDRMKNRPLISEEVAVRPDVPQNIPVKRLTPDDTEERRHLLQPNREKSIVERDSGGYDRIIVHYDTLTDNEEQPKQVSEESQHAKKTTEKTPKKREPKDPQSLYKEGFQAYRHGDHEKAITLLSRFVKEYPSSDLADNALYWIGECYYDEQKFATAKRYFTKVVTDYPKGNKVPDAMLKLGMCNEMQSRFEEARRLFKAVMLSYPDTQAARIAMERIKSLR